MEVNVKYNLGERVFFIGDGNIYQAIIGEVRFINRFVNDRGTVVQKEYKIYRLASNKEYKEFFRNHKVNIDYRGEFDANYWFEESQIYSNEDEALNYLRDNIIYAPNVNLASEFQKIEDVTLN